MEQITQAPAQEEGVMSETTSQSSEPSDALRLQQLQANEPNALHRAAETGDVNAVKLLIQRGCAVDERDEQYRTAMLVAAQEGHADVVAELIRNGAMVDAVNRNERSALWYAARDGHLQVVVELIRNKATVDPTDGENGDWRTPLSCAAENGHLDIVAELIRNGARVNVDDQSHRTPLSYAAASGHSEVVAELIESGAAVDASDNKLRTPLSYAAEGGHLSIVSELIHHGAAVDYKANNRRTAVTYAAQRGHLEVVVELICNGAAVDDVDGAKRGWGSALPFAAKSGHFGIVKELLRRGAAVNISNSDEMTALSYAAKRGHFEIVKELLHLGAAVDIKDEDGRTALSYAAEGGHFQVVAELMRKNAAADIKDCDWRTALSYAAEGGRFDIVVELIRNGATIDTKDNDERTPLTYAAGDGSIVAELIKAGAAVDDRDKGDRTALSYAAEGGHSEVVTSLLHHGAALDGKDRRGRAALSYAAESGHSEVVNTLIQRGAAVDATDADGRTALSHAAEHVHLAVVAVLISHDAAVNEKDKFARAPLSYAAKRRDSDFIDRNNNMKDAMETKGRPALSREGKCALVVAELIKHGATVDVKDQDGRTALWYAAERGYSRVVAKLIEHGASVDAKDNEGRTALVHAAAIDSFGIVEDLIHRGADIDAKNNDGRTSLSYAACRGQFDTVAKLLQYGAAVNTKDDDGRTPLSYASRHGHLDVVTELIRHGAALDAKDNEGRTALSRAAQFYRDQVFVTLLQRGAAINTEDNDGRTALSYAAERGHFDIATVLLLSNAAVDTKDSKGRTALSYAVERGDDQKHGDVQLVGKLLRRGAAIDAKDNKGKTALLYAVESGNGKFVAKLIRHGAAIDARNSKGRTALSQAAKRGRSNLIAKLVSNPAAVDAKDDKGRTALSLAAEHDQGKSVTKLIELGADVDAKDNDGRTAVSYAAESGHEKVTTTLVRLQADVNTQDNDGRTALSYAAKAGHGKVVAMLIRLHATVDAKDDDGRSALSYAAEQGHFDVVGILLHRGAAVDSLHSNGRTALSYAAERGNGEVVAKLIQRGAAVDAKDREGRTAISHAVLKGKEAVVEQLFRSSVVDESSNSVALFVAAAMGKLASVKELIAAGKCVDCRTRDGRTPLFYAAEFGHADVIAHLIKSGASVAAKACVNTHSPRESETQLTLAGRAGHMKVFQALVEAGAPVNVRRGDDGETPLISAARSDYFAGVQLLISHGGRLREAEVSADEYPLIPGSLETMRTLCDTTFEFEPACSRVLDRLQEVCSQLQESDAAQANEGALVSFATILFRFCRLLFDIKKRQLPLSRFISSRAITNRVQDFQEEQDHFVAMLSLEHSGRNWKDLVNEDQCLLEERFEEQLSSDEALVDGLDSDEAISDTAVLLLYEVKVCRREGQRAALQASLERVVERFLRVCDIQAPDIPEWFISRDDVEFHSWNLVSSDNIYDGKWRKTAVMIETSNASLKKVVKSASKWHQLNHPHVVKLLGACHIGSVKFFASEMVQEGKQLQEVVSVEPNRPAVLKRLYEAALGLQYLHNQGIVHKNLRSENIVVDPGVITILYGIGGSSRKHYADKRRSFHWLAPEVAENNSSVSLASDIYAFAMCIWEALSLELPWKDANESKATERLKRGKLPGRPERLSDGEWALIKKMCATDPSERVPISYVVNRLRQFIYESDQINRGVKQKSSASTETENKTIDEHKFAELDGETISNALQYIRSRSEKLEGHDWMSDNVYPALEHNFALLQERQKTPVDAEVLQFCASLSRFQRYLRTAVSERSVYELARSRRVAEVHHVVYAELDRLLDALDVPEADPIRVWSRVPGKLSESEQVGSDLKHAAPRSDHEKANANSSAVTLKQFDTPSATHKLWTQTGLAASPDTPTWYLSLRDLVFSESDQIGKGSFGTVYKGLWRGTPVVIKFMGYEEDFDTISTELLLHEVRVWHRLNHPHVLKLYGACHVDKRYFVCEYASNGELRKYLSKPGNEHLMWQKLNEAALGLEYLHRQNIAHNDLKCDNIMVGVDGKAKLIDFGLSCLLNEAEIQIDVKKMGAVNWRSPEYLAGERPSLVSDVYSFAMCIVEVVSGDIPWGRPMIPAQVRFQLKRGNIPNLPESTNEKQRNLIQLMTKFNPAKRARMSYVVDKLNEIVHDEKSRP